MITIQYGPWVPDLANIPFQMPDQEGPVQVPVADCLNVYYVNGVYRSISSPVADTFSIGPQAVIGAFTALDSTGAPIIVAGIPAGVKQRGASSWSSISGTVVPASGAKNWRFCEFQNLVYMLSAGQYSAQLTASNLYSYQLSSLQANAVSGAPIAQVVGVVGQFVMVGDISYVRTGSGQLMGTGNGVTTSFSITDTNAPLYPGSISITAGSVTGIDNGNGSIIGTGISGTVNYDSGAILVTFTTAPGSGVNVYDLSATAYRSRLQWSAIGNGSNWPPPLTNAAIAVQSGIQDLETEYGPIMFIAGYPLYGVIFQRNAITRASYIGGNVVFSWQTYARNQGLLAAGAAVQVGANTYFLSDAGFFYTDGANIIPIGTAQDNSAGIDQWFFSTVNKSALSAISAGYDAQARNILFAIPTGSNLLPDTLLSYNVLAGRWTRSTLATEFIWIDSDGSTDRLGLFNQSHIYELLTGSSSTTGYLESCDLQFSDGFTRDTNGVRPNGAMTSPTVTVGTRNTLEQSVTYNAGYAPDSFGAGFAPALTEGLYTRIRVSDTNATSIHGATCDMTPGGLL